MKFKFSFALLLALAVGTLTAQELKPAAFAPGENVIFFGDSITGNAWYASNIQQFVAPRRAITRAFGVPGDKTEKALLRLDFEVFRNRPDRVFVMFGMNDIQATLYTSEKSNLKKRAERLTDYRKNLEAIVEKLLAAKIKTVLVTCTPYNQYGTPTELSPIKCPFANEPGLADAAVIVKEVGKKFNIPVIDLYTPLTAVVKAHPDSKIWRVDRVHPDPGGHIIMAAEMLRACGESPVVGSVEITGHDVKTDHAEVKDFTRDDKNFISFKYRASRLPFVPVVSYKLAEETYPLTENINREMLKITDLPEGSYRVLGNGNVIGEYDAAELAKGVNIALADDAPGQRQATSAQKLLNQLRRVDGLLTAYRQVRHTMVQSGIDFNDQAAVEAALGKSMAKARKTNIRVKYTENIHARYRQAAAKLDELKSESVRLRNEYIEAVQPKFYKMAVEKVHAIK